MTAFYGDFNRAEQEDESLRTIAKALEMGINFLDTAWIYQVRSRLHRSMINIFVYAYSRLELVEEETLRTKNSWEKQ